MKHRLIIFHTFLIVIVLVNFGCTSIVKTNVIQSSYDIKQSKELGVFVQEYVPIKNVFILGDKEVNIKEVWEEYYWIYKNQKREIEKKDNIEGYVKIDTETSDLFDINFIFNSRKNGISGNKLTFEPTDDIDTLTFFFYNKKDTVEVVLVKR